jgi:hypothetical protein
VLIDDGKTAERYGLGYSGCVLIDREGNVVSAYKDSLAPPTEIEKLLGGQVNAAAASWSLREPITTEHRSGH